MKTHAKIAKFKYNQSVKNALFAMLRGEVLPLRFDGYQAEAKTGLYDFVPDRELSYAAEKHGEYDA